jgi:hypothetical protein
MDDQPTSGVPSQTRDAIASAVEATATAASGAPQDTAEGLDQIVRSAARLGVELDQREAAEWLAAMQSEVTGGDIVVDVDTGVYGHRVTMLDFTPAELARFRAIGRIVGFEERENVKTALALSGSAAQSKIQSYPGDADYFERVHITANSRDEACAILRDLMREKALATLVGPTYRLWEVKFGVYPFDADRGGAPVHKGGTISWSPTEVQAGAVTVTRDGEPIELRWADLGVPDTGWCKLDWIVADPTRHALANASNVLDVTWEAPDGTIEPLDKFIDPYFQEVYLEKESLPLFNRIVSQLSSDAVDTYVDDLEYEVHKYVTREKNFGKAARRMYNVFRLTGRYAEAAYLRELFDEPTTALYQIAALIRTLDEADRPGAAFGDEMLLSQTDALIISAVAALEGKAETDMVRALLAVRDNLARKIGADERSAEVEQVRTGAIAAVNNYFERRLMGMPQIKAYLDDLARREQTADK